MRIQDTLAVVLVGGAVITASSIVVPSLVAGTVPTYVSEVATPASTPIQVESEINTTDTVDMNQWEPTGGPGPTPYVPGSKRKGK